MRFLEPTKPEFPDAATADGRGLVALGGRLSVEWLLAAYRKGIFPWTVNPITWWSPDPRGIIELDQFHIPKSLGKVLRRGQFEVTRDKAFDWVMRACAMPRPGRRESWITPEFIAAYTELHKAGHAHSVETWLEGEFVGGVYGVSVGGFFAGESMFHDSPNASKVALCHLVEHLRERDFELFDIQMITPVTRQLGAVLISRAEYLKRLEKAVGKKRAF